MAVPTSFRSWGPYYATGPYRNWGGPAWLLTIGRAPPVVVAVVGLCCLQHLATGLFLLGLGAGLGAWGAGRLCWVLRLESKPRTPSFSALQRAPDGACCDACVMTSSLVGVGFLKRYGGWLQYSKKREHVKSCKSLWWLVYLQYHPPFPPLMRLLHDPRL